MPYYYNQLQKISYLSGVKNDTCQLGWTSVPSPDMQENCHRNMMREKKAVLVAGGIY